MKYKIKVKDEIEIDADSREDALDKLAGNLRDKKELVEIQTTDKIFFVFNVKILQKTFKLQSIWNNDVKLEFTKKGVIMKTVDPAHVGLITQEIPVNSFETYECDSDFDIGLNLDKLNNIFRGVTVKDVVECQTINDDFFVNIHTLTHKIGLEDTAGMADPKIPKLNLPVEVTLKTKMIFEFLKQAEKISDHISIIPSKEKLIFKAEGDKDEVRMDLTSNYLKNYKCDSRYKSLFSIDYLLSVIKVLNSKYAYVTLKIGNDNPIEIVGDAVTKTLVLIAPRIESE